MDRKIETAAVLGSGVMGMGIAAHLANCGIRTLLLDIVPPYGDEHRARGVDEHSAAFRNGVAAAALERARKTTKPAPLFYHPRFAELVTPGNLEDHLERLADCDWVVEAVVEKLDVKRTLFAGIERHRKPDALVSSNTSGLRLRDMVEGRSEAFRRHFLVTHFFNPVRFMHLLEVVPGPDTDPAVVDGFADFARRRLGKGVVFCKDTVNFIANRVGTYGLMRTVREMLERGAAIEEVDAIVGPPLGRPKSAAFRTADLVGLDTMVHVTRNCYDGLPDDEERAVFEPPELLTRMVEQGRLGNKSGGGFYRKDRASGEIQVLDVATGEYRPKQKVRIDSIGVARNTDDLPTRLRQLVRAEDRGGQLAWAVLRDTLLYAARRVPEIADDVVQIDNALRWGFNWELGPFETWDALGFADVCERMRADGKALPALAEAVREAGGRGYYVEQDGARRFFDLASRAYQPVPRDPDAIDLAELERAGKEVAANASASLVDLGDGVLCCEFHSKMNSIDPDLVAMLGQGLDLLAADDRWIGMVIGNQGDSFCAGANLFLVYGAIQQAKEAADDETAARHWGQIDTMVRTAQETLQRVKYSPKPVVAAPFGMTLGGGMEITMAADRVCAHADLFMGQVELGVGVIPGAGGNKELLIRHLEGIPSEAYALALVPAVRQVFEAIGMAKVTTSAHEAQALSFLRPTDQVVVNEHHLLAAAKRMVQAMHLEGYRPPWPRKLRLPGKMAHASFRAALDAMVKQHQITAHEKTMAERLTWVLCGGDTSPEIELDEAYLLELEREAFLALCRDEKSQERMQHFLMTNEPLRN